MPAEHQGEDTAGTQSQTFSVFVPSSPRRRGSIGPTHHAPWKPDLQRRTRVGAL